MVRLSPSAHTTRAGSKPRRACHSCVSKAFCDGCGWPGSGPSTEPRWQASASRSSTGSPAAASACSSRLLADPVRPQTTRRRSARGQRFQLGDDGAAEFAVAAFQHLHVEADLVQHQRQRARSLAAAPAIDQRPPAARVRHHLGLDMARDIARHQRRAALARVEGRDLLVFGADESAFLVVQHRPVDGARQPVFGKFALAARVDDGVELGQPRDRLGGGDAPQGHRIT